MYISGGFNPWILALMIANVGTRSALSSKADVVGSNVDHENNFPFYNITLPWSERVDDLVGRLTVDEIVQQLSHGGTGKLSSPAPAISRLGIKPYQWDTECLRGDLIAGNATSFPQAIGLAASFSSQVVKLIGESTSLEVRAKNNYYTSRGDYGEHKGLSCFSPVVNIMRHPGWGRAQESYGEDPYLTSQLARAFIQGLHGSHPRYVRASSGCKHLAAYAGPDSNRNYFNANVSDTQLHETFLPAFRACVEAGSFSIMCSYNAVNSVPACANSQLMKEVLRNQWNFNGYVVSDMEAIRRVHDTHNYTKDYLSTAVTCVKAGVNLELSGFWVKEPPVFDELYTAFKQGLVDEELLRQRVKPLFYTRMRLGEFDPPEMNPYKQLKQEDIIQSNEQRAKSVWAAVRTFVLLQNNGILPLKRKYQKISVIGPFSGITGQVYGDKTATFDANFAVSALNGVINTGMAESISSAEGCKPPTCSDYNQNNISAALTDTQLVFVCLGTGSIEGEGRDRRSLDLPKNQILILEQAINTTVPVVLLLVSGGPVLLSNNSLWSKLAAVLQLHFPAQALGDALTQVLLGKTSPAGRLPYTWYSSDDQLPNIADYSMQNVTYRYFTGTPLFPFGYGLSYTKFTYSEFTTPKSTVHAGDDISFTVTVTNSGGVDSDEVIQLYVSGPLDVVHKLVAFDRIHIVSGGKQTISLRVEQTQLSVWRESVWMTPSGRFTFSVGGQQPGQVRRVDSNVLETVIDIVLG